jgi:LuxR family maltose regulon positive regulatory protein
VLDALAGPGASIWSMGVPRVGSALATLERPLVLALDDLHAVGNLSCLDVLAALCEYVPPGSQIAVASREEPALPLARWRTLGWLHEIGVADLRLDEREAGVLLKEAGAELDPAGVAALTGRTEGWPAGLYLAALSLQAGAPGPAHAETFTGEDRFVSEYFRYELLSRLPKAEARFLIYTSVLDRMCGGLCDAVLQTTRSASTLASLERSNGFVVPLDRQGEWYRYHHLFGQLLRNELERSDPAAAAALHRRAMAWCMANDLTEAAVRYGHAAGEKDIVAGLIDTLTMPLYYGGRMATVEEWLGWFSDQDLARFPALAVFGAWFRVLTGRPEEAARWLSVAEGATSAIPLSDGSATIAPWVANLRAFMMPDGVERALADAKFALGQFAPASGWRPSALLIRGVAHALLGVADLARADLAAAVETGLESGATDDTFNAQAQLALLAAHQDAWGEAGRWAGQAKALVEETRLDHYAASALVHAVVARVALHEGRQSDARAALTRAHRLRPLLGYGLPWFAVQVGLELTRAHLALGEVAAARTVLTESERVLQLRPDLGSLAAEARELRERVRATSSPAGSPAMSSGCFPISPPISPIPRSASGCSSPGTRSRPRRPRCSASSAHPRAAPPSSAPSRSGSWRPSPTHRGQSSPDSRHSTGPPDDAKTVLIGAATLSSNGAYRNTRRLTRSVIRLIVPPFSSGVPALEHDSDLGSGLLDRRRSLSVGLFVPARLLLGHVDFL